MVEFLATNTISAAEESLIARPRRTKRLDFVGNVITQPFAKVAGAVAEDCELTCHHAGFGQVAQMLSSSLTCDYLAVHLDHRWFFDAVADDQAVKRADELATQVRSWLDRNSGVIILNTLWAPLNSPIDRDMHAQTERLAAINAVMFALARENGRIRIIDVAGIALRLGSTNTFRERNRYLMQHPYSPAATSLVVEAYARTIRMDLRARRKVIVLDADNTLWGGVLGEDGADGVMVDRDYPGIIYYIFQQQLVHLRSLGYLLVVVTKNNESDFLELFTRRQMPLALSDLVTFRSNWQEKSENIAGVARELNLGLDAFVFIDDNPFEIEEVRSRLPGVECWLFPKDAPESAVNLLSDIESLRAATTTSEDLVKTEQYRIEAERNALRGSSSSLEDYLKSLDIEVVVSVNEPAHISRIAQLSNKTNQFNLTVRRYTESDIAVFMKSGVVFDFRVRDRFGDMGIVGVVIVNDDEIDTFLMSCRALGRKIEAGILHFVVSKASCPLKAIFHRTAKNDMVSRFFDDNGFSLISSSDDERRYLMNKGPMSVGHIRFVET